MMRYGRRVVVLLAAALGVLPGSPANAGPILVTGAGLAGGPHVRVLDAATGAEIISFFAYDPQLCLRSPVHGGCPGGDWGCQR
jgi:hypothetical protein